MAGAYDGILGSGSRRHDFIWPSCGTFHTNCAFASVRSNSGAPMESRVDLMLFLPALFLQAAANREISHRLVGP